MWGLLGLETAISLGTVDPLRDERGWRFGLDENGRDPVLGIGYLSEAYRRTDPSYAGRVTVPTLVDVESGLVVTNDFPQLTLDLSTEWSAFHREGAPDLYPAPLREEIDAVNELVYRDVNNGVYRCGFASTQEAYEAAFVRLFDRLDWLGSGSPTGATWSGSSSPRPTSGCSRPWSGSTRPTTATSSATGRS